jgi:hypothetical protein
MPTKYKVLERPQAVPPPPAEEGSGTIPAAGSGRPRVAPLWTPADKFLPPPHESVLATDQGTYYVAIYDGQEWFDALSEEAIDCYITHWMWLPEFPEE